MSRRLQGTCEALQWKEIITSLVQEDFFVPPLASCCKMMNSRMSLAVRQGLSITTECPQFSSRSTLHPGTSSAMTVAPEASTTWTNTGQLCLCRYVTEVSLYRPEQLEKPEPPPSSYKFVHSPMILSLEKNHKRSKSCLVITVFIQALLSHF